MEINPFDDGPATATDEHRARRPGDRKVNRTRGRTIATFSAAPVLICTLVVAGAMSPHPDPAAPTTPTPAMQAENDLEEHSAEAPPSVRDDAVATSDASNSPDLGPLEHSDCTEHLDLSAAAVEVDPLFWTYGVLDAIARTDGTLDAEILRRLHAIQTLTPPTRDNLPYLDAVDSAVAEIERHPCRVALNGA